MRVSRRTEIVLGLVVPLLVIVGLLVVGLSSDQTAVAVAFMAAVPMFAAMFTGAAFTGIVAVATLVAAMVASASAYGQDFYDAVPIVVGVIVGAGAAVIASQMKAAAASPRREPAPSSGASDRASSPASEPGTDELTGLPGRGGIMEAVSSVGSTGSHVVALLDCDAVAAINDQYGRDIGDVFIFAVAGRTRWALPEEDVVARWDGGTFLLVITGDPETVGPTLGLITDKVNKNPIRCDAGLVPTTVSLGAAVWPEGADFAEAVARARRALYSAKAQGPGHLVLDA
jgi:diguanylate cyclase (GGDEF)-like protein